MSMSKIETLGSLGEQRIIARLNRFALNHERLMIGIGDDCAVASTASDDHQVFTSDATIEGIHFEITDQPERIGNKAVGRVLSDLAAMGAIPEWILINVTAPASMHMAYLEKVYAGITKQLERCGGRLIGGDLCEGPSFGLHLFATGNLSGEKPLCRKGACVGDIIWSTGALGGSRAGKHLDFIPRIQEGIWLRESGRVNSMMDVTDGLAQDIAHLCSASFVGASIDGAVLEKMSSKEAALYDGEDFELLFTSEAADEECLLRLWEEVFKEPLWKLGRITDKKYGLQVRWNNHEEMIEVYGNQHYRSS